MHVRSRCRILLPVGDFIAAIRASIAPCDGLNRQRRDAEVNDMRVGELRSAMLSYNRYGNEIDMG
jgi:hypothetical protein